MKFLLAPEIVDQSCKTPGLNFRNSLVGRQGRSEKFIKNGKLYVRKSIRCQSGIEKRWAGTLAKLLFFVHVNLFRMSCPCPIGFVSSANVE